MSKKLISLFDSPTGVLHLSEDNDIDIENLLNNGDIIELEPSLFCLNNTEEVELKKENYLMEKELGINIDDQIEMNIKLLHEYNEIKDIGQSLLGKLAEIKGTTTKEMYKEYEMCLND